MQSFFRSLVSMVLVLAISSCSDVPHSTISKADSKVATWGSQPSFKSTLHSAAAETATYNRNEVKSDWSRATRAQILFTGSIRSGRNLDLLPVSGQIARRNSYSLLSVACGIAFDENNYDPVSDSYLVTEPFPQLQIFESEEQARLAFFGAQEPQPGFKLFYFNWSSTEVSFEGDTEGHEDDNREVIVKFTYKLMPDGDVLVVVESSEFLNIGCYDAGARYTCDAGLLVNRTKCKFTIDAIGPWTLSIDWWGTIAEGNGPAIVEWDGTVNPKSNLRSKVLSGKYTSRLKAGNGELVADVIVVSPIAIKSSFQVQNVFINYLNRLLTAGLSNGPVTAVSVTVAGGALMRSGAGSTLMNKLMFAMINVTNRLGPTAFDPATKSSPILNITMPGYAPSLGPASVNAARYAIAKADFQRILASLQGNVTVRATQVVPKGEQTIAFVEEKGQRVATVICRSFSSGTPAKPENVPTIEIQFSNIAKEFFKGLASHPTDGVKFRY